jgi:homoisocitrate dehydrogenase
LATIRSAALMLESLAQGKYSKYALLINKAVDSVLKDGKSLTPDLGGNATTKQSTEAVLHHLNTLLQTHKI